MRRKQFGKSDRSKKMREIKRNTRIYKLYAAYVAKYEIFKMNREDDTQILRNLMKVRKRQMETKGDRRE